MKQIFLSLIVALFVTAPLAVAQQKGTLKLKVEAFQEIAETVGEETKIKTVPIAKAVPGTEVIYVITYENTGEQPATDVVVKNAVPEQLTYKDGSAFGSGSTIELSVDGGKTWGQLGALTVAGVDGNPAPAQAGDVTHVRWTLGFAVQSGDKGQVTYRATLK